MLLERRAKLRVFKLPALPYLILRDRNYNIHGNLLALSYKGPNIHLDVPSV
jgi:hypothetical protein